MQWAVTRNSAQPHRHVGQGCRLAEFAEGALVIAEHQRMALGAVLEVVVNAFLLTQALSEVQVALVVLHAVVPVGINRWSAEELIATFNDAVLLQYLGDELRHCQVLENPLVGAQGQVTQLRHDAQFVAGQALPDSAWAT